MRFRPISDIAQCLVPSTNMLILIIAQIFYYSTFISEICDVSDISWWQACFTCRISGNSQFCNNSKFLFIFFLVTSINSSPPRSALVQVMAYRRQDITATHTELLSNWPLGTNFSENLIEIQNLLFKKIHLKISSAKWRSFCPEWGWVKEALCVIV